MLDKAFRAWNEPTQVVYCLVLDPKGYIQSGRIASHSASANELAIACFKEDVLALQPSNGVSQPVEIVSEHTALGSLTIKCQPSMRETLLGLPGVTAMSTLFAH